VLCGTLRQQRAELSQDEVRLLEDISPGVVPELVTARTRLALSAAVLLPGVAGMVERVAVEFHGEGHPVPAAVDPAATSRAIELGERQSGLDEQLAEPSLEPAQQRGCVTLEDQAKVPRALGGRPPREDFLDVPGCCGVFDPGLVAGLGEVSERESSAARSTIVWATVVTGMPRQVIESSRGSRVRLVWIPLTSLLVWVVTSGGGGATRPRVRPSRYAAARPLRTARSPHAQTAAR